jgi:hypothetical protein
MGANPAVPDIYVEIDYMAQLVKNPATNVVTLCPF